MKETWEKLLDTLYEMGGYGEYPDDDTDQELDEDVDILGHSNLSVQEIREGADSLDRSNLAEVGGTVDARGRSETYHRVKITLNQEGFRLAHDRREGRRNRETNNSVAYLTLVLAVVGLAQAFAITAQIESLRWKFGAAIVTIVAAIVLGVIYRTLYMEEMLPF